MGPKRGKKGTPWPESRFADDPDIRAYVAAAIKDLEALKKHQEALEIGMPRELSTSVVDAFLYLAQRVKNTPTNEQLAQQLAKVKLHVEKTQKEVSQASREITTTKSNTNRLVEAICHPTSPGTYTVKNSPSFSHVTTSSESYVQAWGRKVPSNPPTVPSVGLSSRGSLPSTPYPSQEDLEVYLEHTDPNILNPIYRFPDKVVEKANLVIHSTQDTTIAHQRIAAACTVSARSTARTTLDLMIQRIALHRKRKNTLNVLIAPQKIQPGAISPNDPTPAEVANTEQSPRAPARTATTRRSANSRSKSAAAAQKRVAERSEPEPISPTSGDPTNRSSKKPIRAQWDKDLVIDADPNPEPKTGPETQIKYTYNTRARQNTKPPPGTLVLQSDIAPLEISHMQAVRTVHQSKSVCTILDDDLSEDELTQPSIHEAPQDPIKPAQEADTLMTTNLEDST
ncbi:hypothetical protein TSTA_051950 [Talaromyces stipitatus ATCC 10500]|uniref:Uncharacterized protein n=1 Tax=Talaromyces stipitatus (strain ATCC 10500 / CBS 375.48 / QM 6759 / NRRL 1006) TaxID=441959 RepID=B8MJQ9_TALSN|nr:uncharacterized protein TSTA_051950 [Talaromyces stipitatus ATCC 10500]EED15758.1 hypothetical protein TSTA_051950 [Talaromyces stipitatus ATCC 10500]